MKESKLSLEVSSIIGLPLWDIVLGSDGLHLQFGKKLPGKIKVIDCGEIAIWSECNIKIYRGTVEADVVIDLPYPQNTSDEKILINYLNNEKVVDAFVRKKDRSLHILFSNELIISSYPWTKASEKCWTIISRRNKKSKSFTIHTDDISINS